MAEIIFNKKRKNSKNMRIGEFLNIIIMINEFLSLLQLDPAVASGDNGKNNIFWLGPFDIICRVSKNLICIAALLSKKSAASLINLAASVSA